jgi:hypothetical protein
MKSLGLVFAFSAFAFASLSVAPAAAQTPSADRQPDATPLTLYQPPTHQTSGSARHGQTVPGAHTGNLDTDLFLPVVNYDSGGQLAEMVAVADLNGDGKPDLVVANCCGGPSGAGAVGVLLGNGDGTFQPVTVYDPGGSPLSVVVGDLNGDGKPDVILANYGCAATNSPCVSVLLGNGDGTFKPSVVYASGGAPWASGPGLYIPLMLADLNHDKKMDVIVVAQSNLEGQTYGDGLVGVLLGNGDGTLRPVALYDTGGFFAMAAVLADVNGDGHPDMVVANCAPTGFSNCGGNGTLGVLLGKSDGTFHPVQTYTRSGSFEAALAVADVSGDGHPDLLVANCVDDNCGGPGTVDVLLGNGDGSFRPATTYSSGGAEARSIEVADLNGDGKLDLVIATGGNIGVLLGNGDGTFEPVTNYSGGAASVLLADIDADGKLDLVASDGTSNFASVLLGNGDGTFSAPFQFPLGEAQWVWLTVADLNGDGRPDVVSANWCAASCGDSTVSVLLNNARPISKTTLISSPNPSIFGQSISFTAKVTSASGTPTGTVFLLQGSTTLATAALVNGAAAFSLSSLPAGKYSIVAAYQGSGNFNPSTSDAVDQTVGTASTTSTLTAAPNPAHVNQHVTYTASLASQYGGAITGTVSFTDQGAVVAEVPLSGNQAIYRVKYDSSGAHAITATYSGDTNNNGSAAMLTESVISSTKTSVVTSGSPSHVGQPVTFTATVIAKFGVVPDGELVTFSTAGKVLGSAPLSNGSTSFTTSSLSKGKHVITASYSGDGIFKGSNGHIQQVVEP